MKKGESQVGNEEGRLWMQEMVRRGYWMAKCELGLNFIAVVLGYVSVLM